MSLSRMVQMQKAIAHPIRLRILAMLRDGPLCGCQISAVAKLAPSTVSEHLAELKRARLVAEKKDGRWVEFRLAPSEAADTILATLFSEIDDDPQVRADQVLTKALRLVPLEELCSVGNDVTRIERAAVANALGRAERIREEAEV